MWSNFCSKFLSEFYGLANVDIQNYYAIELMNELFKAV